MIAFLYTFFQIIKGITNLYNDLRGKNLGQNNIKVLQLSEEIGQAKKLHNLVSGCISETDQVVRFVEIYIRLTV